MLGSRSAFIGDVANAIPHIVAASHLDATFTFVAYTMPPGTNRKRAELATSHFESSTVATSHFSNQYSQRHPRGLLQ